MIFERAADLKKQTLFGKKVARQLFCVCLVRLQQFVLIYAALVVLNASIHAENALKSMKNQVFFRLLAVVRASSDSNTEHSRPYSVPKCTT